MSETILQQAIILTDNGAEKALAQGGLVPHPLDQNPAAVYLASLRPSGRRTMRQALNVLAVLAGGEGSDALSLPWHELRYQHTAALRSALQSRYSVATTNKMLAALRRVLKEAWRLGLMEAEEYRRAADLPGMRAETLPRGRALSSGELRTLMAVCGEDGTPAGARDGAIIAVLYGAGLRRSEAAALSLADWSEDTRGLVVRSGKGGKDRLCYLAGWAGSALSDWLTLRGDAPGPLFAPINKGGQLAAGQPMTAQALMKRLMVRAKEAHLAAFSPHDLRRTFISDLLDAGADIATVQRLAGHASVTTTARYDRRGEGVKRQAADMLYVPYSRRQLPTPNSTAGQ